jgi:hypothetical protein
MQKIMNIQLLRNEGNLETPYSLIINIVHLTVDAKSQFDVPIHVAHQGLSKSFYVEICGFSVSSARVEEMPALTTNLLRGLVNWSRLPSYIFIAKRAKQLYPVYTLDNEVMATTPGGPLFRHVELAKVREYLSDYLHDIGILGKNGDSEKLHVRGVNMKNLSLRRPVFYLKKRVAYETDFWAPVFESGDGKRIYTYAANARREVPISAGQEVIFLRELVAQSLLTARRLTNLHDLRADRIMPAYWQRLAETMINDQTLTIQQHQIPIYHNTYVWAGVETRTDENRIGLHVGKSAIDVAQRMQINFAQRNL